MLSGVATLARLPISFELATVLATVSVGGPFVSSGRCSMLSFVNSSLDGVRVSSGPVPSSLVGVTWDVSSAAIGGSSTTSSATGGGGNSAASTASSCATSGTSAGAGAGSSGGGAGFATGFGTAGFGTEANMLAHVFAAGAAAVGFGASVFGAGDSVALGCTSSFASVAAWFSQAFDSVVGIEVGPEGPPDRVPFAAPPRPRNPPRPRSVPRPRPRMLSPPRARPLPPRMVCVLSVAAVESLTLERDRSLAFLTSANWETCPSEMVSGVG